MDEENDYLEERVIGGRKFRKKDEGHLVEILKNERESNEFKVGSRAFMSHTADFESIEQAHMLSYLQSDKSYSNTDHRLDRFRTNYSGMLKTSVGEYLKVSRPKSKLGEAHRLDEGHEMAKPTNMNTSSEFTSFLKKDDTKGSYKQHIEEMMRARSLVDGENPARGSQSMQGRRSGASSKKKSPFLAREK